MMTTFGVSATYPGNTPDEWAATYTQQRTMGARGCFIYVPQGVTPDLRRLSQVPLADTVVFSPKTCDAATAKTLVDGSPKRTGKVYMVLWQEWIGDMTAQQEKPLADDFLSGWDDKVRPNFVKCGYGTEWDLSQGRGAEIAAGIPTCATHLCWSVYGSLKSDPRRKLDSVAAFMAAHPGLTWGVSACGAAIPPTGGSQADQALWATRMREGCLTYNVPYALWFDRDYSAQGHGNFSLTSNPAAAKAWYGG